MATRSERPRVRRRAERRARGAEGVSKVRTLGWHAVSHRQQKQEWERKRAKEEKRAYEVHSLTKDKDQCLV